MPHEVRSFPRGIADAMFGQEVRIGMIRPFWACTADVTTAEAVRQSTLCSCLADVSHKVTHA
jgi:hypothetical protein